MATTETAPRTPTRKRNRSTARKRPHRATEPANKSANVHQYAYGTPEGDSLAMARIMSLYAQAQSHKDHNLTAVGAVAMHNWHDKTFCKNWIGGAPPLNIGAPTKAAGGASQSTTERAAAAGGGR